MRIHITGNAGAGKTSLAKHLSEQLNYPCFHLDQIVWQPQWKKTPELERAAAIQSIVSGEHWIIEGVSAQVREKADMVVFLDVPRLLCFWRCAKRNLRYLFQSRPELPAECPEILIIPRLVKLIWRFPALAGREIRAEANDSERYVVVKDSAVASLVNSIGELQNQGDICANPSSDS